MQGTVKIRNGDRNSNNVNERKEEEIGMKEMSGYTNIH
jgi:hypothetical protein